MTKADKTPDAEPVAMPEKDKPDTAPKKTGIAKLDLKPDEQGVFSVTKQAGNYVAGQRSPGVGKEIKLTGAQAEAPVRNGELTFVKRVKDEPSKAA